MDYFTKKQTVYEKTYVNLVNAKQRLAVLQAIQPVIGQFVGKKITKRIATAAAKVLPGDMVAVLSWSGAGQFSMAYLTIWGAGLPYDSRVNLFLGYDGDLEEEKADISGWIKSTQEYVAGVEAALENLDSLLVKHDVAMSQLNHAKESCKYLEGLDWRV